MAKTGLLASYEKLTLLLSKDALEILVTLRQKECRFKELPGNSFTKSKRLKELKKEGLIKSIIMNQEVTEKAIIGYQLTEKGEKVLQKLDELFKIM